MNFEELEKLEERVIEVSRSASEVLGRYALLYAKQKDKETRRDMNRRMNDVTRKVAEMKDKLDRIIEDVIEDNAGR